jgi:LAGLIDADG DNA endonuclease family
MITKIQHQIINGLMLGDGHMFLHPNGANPSLYVKRARKDLPYLEYHANIFKELLTDGGIHFGKYFDKRTKKEYEHCYFQTKCMEIFWPYRSQWYPKGIKIIPREIELTPLVIATWFADDGTIQWSKDKRLKNEHPETLTMNLATDGFTEKDVRFLKTKLETIYDFPFHMYEHKLGQYGLSLKKSNYTKKLLSDIDDYFPEGMERKSNIWRRKEAKLSELTPVFICPPCKWCGSDRCRRRGIYSHDTSRIKYSCNECERSFIYPY